MFYFRWGNMKTEWLTDLTIKEKINEIDFGKACEGYEFMGIGP